MGTMASGKTTVAKLLAKELKYKLIEENFGENKFLPRFYKDMKRWAFHSQTFFLMEKVTQMIETGKLLAKKNVIQDTPIQQDAFSYAKAQNVLGNIDDAEWKLYQTPGSGEVPVGDNYDSCHYGIKAISDTRTQVKLSYWMGGGDRKSIYVYEIEDNRVYPRFYNERADYFGWSFSAFLLAFISTFIFIIIFELLVVRRFIFKSEKAKQNRE